MAYRILIVEDDAPIRTGLVDTLRAKGDVVDAVDRGEGGLAQCKKAAPDLIVLDLMLPDIEGFEVCRRLKESRFADAPIIMLTARGSELDRVRGLELGADDYVTKPFSLMELLARIQNVLRRCYQRGSGEQQVDDLRFGQVTINFRRHEGYHGERKLELTDRAYTILQVFARRPGEVISREELLEQAWGLDGGTNTRTVDNHIVKIRKEIEDDAESPRYLVTIHGIGYKLAI